MLVIAPTRELALQVRGELSWLYAAAGGRVASVVGGTDPVAERRALAAGAHVVVGTPGRMRDHIERGNLRPDSVRVVVLDEADEMLDMGFREELEAILDAAPAERRTLMFSATVPRPIATLARRYQRDALRIEAAGEGAQHGDIEYRALLIAPHETERAVVNALRFFDAPRTLVFCRTRAAVSRLHGNLAERGFAAVALSGELTPGGAQPRAAGPARRARAGVRGDGRGGARHRPAGPRAGDPRRAADRPGDPAPPQRAHRAGGAEGHQRPAGRAQRGAAPPNGCSPRRG